MAASAEVTDYKTSFIESCIKANVLTFGTYTLKSGRQSPYFFNAGLFHRADLLRSISIAYALTILHSLEAHSFSFDVLFGPAYKGIPLATATVEKLAEYDPGRFGKVCYSFNRKEAKDHGEGGNIVGAALKGKNVLIIDDVITAGTAMKEAIRIIQREGGTVVGIIVALDRMERMPAGEDDEPKESAIAEVRRRFQVPVLSIVTLDDLIGVLNDIGSEDDIRRLKEYKHQYGAVE